MELGGAIGAKVGGRIVEVVPAEWVGKMCVEARKRDMMKRGEGL